jgi:threonine synthase
MEIVPEKLIWSVDEREPSIWRYKSLLPPAESIVSLGEGLTDLRRVDGVLVKDETKNPTGSYVDRGSSVMISSSNLIMSELEYLQDVTISLASYLIASGREVRVIIDPEGVDINELLYLSQLDIPISFSVGGARASYENPFMIEGFKTIAYELYEFKGKFDGIVIPSESGILAYGVIKGFRELEEMGLMKVPQIYLVHYSGIGGEFVEFLKSLGAKTMSLDTKDTMESLVKLARLGIYVKPISAMAYSAASRLGSEYIALLTGSSRRWKNPSSFTPLTGLQRRILDVMGDREMTAYQIWRLVGGATLQGVYKALSKLSRMGLVSSERKLYKRRMKRVYKLRSSGGGDVNRSEGEGDFIKGIFS